MTKAKTTDSQEELLTQVDENNTIIGGISRGIAHNTPGIFYRTIYILVFNDKNQVLLQKRSSTKDLYPSCWDLSVGGHVNLGDSYLETAIREIKEEVSIYATKDDLFFKGEVLVKLPSSGEYFYVYEYKLKPTDKITASIEEINQIQWMSIDDIKKSMSSKSLKWYPRPEQTISALY